MRTNVVPKNQKLAQTWSLSLPRLGRILSPYALVLPAALLMILLTLVNSAYGTYLSFLDWNEIRLSQRYTFVGLGHYAEVMADPTFWNSVKISLTWSSLVVPASFVVGLYFALLLNEPIRGRGLMRALILLPYATPLVVAAITWRFLLAPGFGLVDDWLFTIGFPDLKYMNWLGNVDFALPFVMVTQVWRWAPFFAVTLLAGLQSIPDDLYEAATMDGAGMIARFRHITWPLLLPVSFVGLLQGLIWSLHNFTLVFVMTEGGPVRSTELVTIYLWRIAFSLGQLGKGAAVGTLLVAILAMIGTPWVLKLMRRDVTR